MKRTFLALCCFIFSFFCLMVNAATTNAIMCLSDNMVLSVPGDMSEYVGRQWSTTPGLTNTNTLTPTFTPLVAGEHTITFTARKISEGLFPNGDFEMGNTPLGLSTFQSDYILATPNGDQTLFPEGRYTITRDVNSVHSHSQCRNDHTTGSGYMLAVNGGYTPSTIVWRPATPIAVTPNTDYAFSAWIMRWTPNDPAQLQFRINGVNLGAVQTPPTTTCEWGQVYVLWNSGSNTTADITLLNMQTASGGNDFAMDDISFALSNEVTYTFIITVVDDCTSTENITMCLEEPRTLNALDHTVYSNPQWTPAENLNSATVARPTFTPTATGLQTLTFRGVDSRGLTITKTFNIDVHQCHFSESLATCVSEPLMLNAGDTNSYSNIQWSPSGLTGADTATPTFTPAQSDNFTYTMRALRNDLNLNIQKTVTVHAVECTFTNTHNVAFCSGSTAALTLTAIDGINHLWSNSETTQSIIVNPVNAQYTCTSTGNDLITSPADQNFLRPQTNIDIFYVQVVDISIKAPKYELCIGEELTVTGAVNNNFWTTGWRTSNNGLAVTPVDRTSALLTANRAGNYDVYFEVEIPHEDAPSSVCQTSQEISVHPNPIIFSAQPTGRDLHVTTNMNTGGSQPFTYLINGRDYFYQPIIPDLNIGTHKLVVINAEGCQSREVEFTIAEVEVVPAQFFTPNNDGDNDEWKIAGIDFYKNAIVEIYDRTGKLLFRSAGNFSGWNGKYNGKHLPSTDYWYIIRIDEIDKTEIGNFTLQR